MSPLRWLAVLLIAVLMVTALVFIGRAFAANPLCVSVQDDREDAEAHGLRWLGIRRAPYSAATQFIYYTNETVTFVTTVVDGCIGLKGIPIGLYVPEEEV